MPTVRHPAPPELPRMPYSTTAIRHPMRHIPPISDANILCCAAVPRTVGGPSHHPVRAPSLPAPRSTFLLFLSDHSKTTKSYTVSSANASWTSVRRGHNCGIYRPILLSEIPLAAVWLLRAHRPRQGRAHDLSALWVGPPLMAGLWS